MSVNDLFLDSRAVQSEFILAGIFAIILLGGITYTDTRFHDFYVKPTISYCHEGNKDGWCDYIRVIHEVEKTAQMELGKVYWDILAFHVIWISAMMGFVRLSFVILGKKKFTGTRIFMIILWMITSASFFMGGFLDYFYYTARGMDVPTSLPWLDGAGIFNYTKAFGSDPLHVDASDLYLTMT